MRCEESFITIKLIWHNYLILNLDICIHKITTKTDCAPARWPCPSVAQLGCQCKCQRNHQSRAHDGDWWEESWQHYVRSFNKKITTHFTGRSNQRRLLLNVYHWLLLLVYHCTSNKKLRTILLTKNIWTSFNGNFMKNFIILNILTR